MLDKIYKWCYKYNRIIEKLATQRSVAEKTGRFSIAGLLKDKGVYENRCLFFIEFTSFLASAPFGTATQINYYYHK